MDITREHLEFWRRIQVELSNSSVDIAVFFPIYTLIPHASYPTQFQQASEALSYVVKDLGRNPQDIILAGDSAGGNLCIAIISHLSHPSRDIPRVEIETCLRGMILISPWVSFDTSWPSMTYNLGKDIDAIETLRDWAHSYLNGRAGDNNSEPVLAPVDWWKGAQVDRTLVVAGSDEVFIDSIRAWTENFKVSIAVPLSIKSS